MAHPVGQYSLLMFTNTASLFKTKHNLTFRMGQKIKLQTLFSSVPNTDGFFTECSSEKIVKIGQYLTKKCTKFRGLLFLGHPVFNVECNALVDVTLIRPLKKVKVIHFGTIDFSYTTVSYTHLTLPTILRV